MASNLSNKCTKTFCKQPVLVELIVEDAVTSFLQHGA